MEGVRHADGIIGPVRAFADHDVGGHPREIGLIGNRDQIEQQPHLLIDRHILLCHRYLGRRHARDIAVLRKLNAPFDLLSPCPGSRRGALCRPVPAPVAAPGLRSAMKSRMLRFCLTMATRSSAVAPSPNNCAKTLRGLDSIGKGGVCIPVRQRGAVEAAESGLARDRLGFTLRADLHRRQRCLLTDAPGQ